MKICSLQKKILIIKFGGLGDVILSLNAIYSIFNHHNKCKLILLTEEPYNKLLVSSNWFEKIFTIKRSFFYFLDLLKIKNVIDPNEVAPPAEVKPLTLDSNLHSTLNPDPNNAEP